jgi:hypothetical protein
LVLLETLATNKDSQSGDDFWNLRNCEFVTLNLCEKILKMEFVIQIKNNNSYQIVLASPQHSPSSRNGEDNEGEGGLILNSNLTFGNYH